MAKTPTVHNPTHFEPADYEVQDYLDNQRPQYVGQPIPAWQAEIAEWEGFNLATFGPSWRQVIHRCIHCGNGRVRWITAVRHLPTQDVVVFGSDCTDRLGFANKVAFKLALIQTRAKAGAVRLKAYRAQQAFLAAHSEIAEALTQIDLPVHAKNTFAKDVLAKLNRYGSLSDKQIAAVVSSLQRDRDFAARAAVTAVEVKGDAPTGRVEVTGTVLSTKWQSGSYGDTLKMLVKLPTNAKVWVSVPGGSGIERGDTVTVKATWTPSKDDKSFGFGSRPTLVNRTAAV